MPVPDSLTVDALKKRIDIERGVDNELLEDYLEMAFEQAQALPPHGTGRRLTPTPVVGAPAPVQEPVDVRGGYIVRVPDARAITEVLADDQVVTDYRSIERNGHIVRLELPRRARVVKVTGHFGFAELPVSLREAIYILAGRYWYEREGGYADRVAVAEGAAAQYYRALPSRAAAVFKEFTVPSDVWGLV